ncbi:type II secretion system F family protein [Iodobacter ciconiae]|uniref:Type II secretion system F family protein n=1 Tax=Iodobacter ciconiae TaxID=2496266 RepID=A0A3S8ZPR4_9NEIS|nr:type II secretion system F family protein [Iodobacter ciconiae]AZN35470.1 type II secretion system F family protein [Iodobacter ciconiae]
MTGLHHSPAPRSLVHQSETPPALGTATLRLKVQGSGDVIQTLDFPGISLSEATRRAAARGLTVLAVESMSVVNANTSLSTGRYVFPLLLFSQELMALLDAGLNLTEALSTLVAKERQVDTRAVLQQILQTLQEGRNFSDVLTIHAQHFPAVYVATVRASERTGDLPQALSRYIAYQIQFEILRKKLVSAAIYPAMLLAVGGLVTLFLLGYVVPRFSVVYESSGRDLPWLSSILLSFGKWIYTYWPQALVLLGTVTAVLIWCLSRQNVRGWLLNQFLRLPLLSVQAGAFRLARFYRAVSLLLAAGIPLARALEMVSGLLSPAQQAALAKSRLAIEQGQSLSVALAANGLSTPVADSLIKVGERSGQMTQMLERTASFADEEFARWIDWASRLLEPLLMVVIGVVIGTVVVLMYLPIFELAGSLQ